MKSAWLAELARELSGPSNIIFYSAGADDEGAEEAIAKHFGGWPLPEIIFILPEKDAAPDPMAGPV